MFISLRNLLGLRYDGRRGGIRTRTLMRRGGQEGGGEKREGKRAKYGHPRRTADDVVFRSRWYLRRHDFLRGSFVVIIDTSLRNARAVRTRASAPRNLRRRAECARKLV